jgi:gliding motility-associated-like protein
MPTDSYLRALCATMAAALGMPGMAQPSCTVNAGPASITLCEGAAQQLNGTVTGTNGPYTYSWSPAQGLSATNIANPTVTATTTTTYTLTVTDADGNVCGSDTITVNVNPAAPALLTSTGPEQITTFNGLTTFSICDPSSSWNFSFADQSQDVAGATRTLNWGDGSPTVTPAHGWTQGHTYGPGLWTLTYSISYPNGCSRTQQYQVFLGTNPGGGISTDPNTNICTGGTLPFYINSVGGNSPGTTYIIDFGDGTQITLDHPPPAVVNHTYTTSTCGMAGGQLNVTFVAQNPCDQTQGQIGPIRVSQTPEAVFTASHDTVCVNTTVTFTDQSVGLQAPACNTPPRNIWSITPATGWTVVSGTMGSDNGNPANPGLWTDGATNLGVQFNQPGTYTIIDRTGNSCGMHTLERTICVEAPPVPAFTLTPTTGCVPLNVSATNTTTSENSCHTTWQWTVSGTVSACATGGFSTQSSTAFQPSWTFDQPGSYTVQFRAINSCNVPPIQQTVTVNAPPQVDIAPLSGICATQCVSPTATVQDCGAAITNHAWAFSGGTPASANTAVPGQVCYPSPTTSTIGLTVTNACGSASDAITLSVGTLPATPEVTSNSPVCAGQPLSLGVTTAPGVSYTWNGPNGYTATGPTITLPNASSVHAGTWTVVAVSNGCEGPPASVEVDVVPPPVVTITPSAPAICAGGSITLMAAGAADLEWSVGGSVVGTGPVLEVAPSSTTTYSVTGSEGSCSSTATMTVTVHPLPTLTLMSVPVLCDQAIPVQLTATPGGGQWSGSGVSSDGVFTPTPGMQGTFTVDYTYTDAFSCTSTASIDVTVGPVTAFATLPPDTVMCMGSVPVILQASPPGGTWSGAGAGGAFVPSSVGSHTVVYTYGAGTCITADTMVVQVLAAQALDVVPDFFSCPYDEPVPLTASPAGGMWSGPGVSGPPFVFDPGAVAPGDHQLTYTHADGIGCVATAITLASVEAPMVVDAGPDLQLCDQPITVQLSGAPGGGVWTANWMAVSPTGALMPNGVGTDTLVYTVTTAGQCVWTDTVIVEVIAIAEPAFAGNDTLVCVFSEPLQLIATPAGGTWSGPQVDPTGLFMPTAPGDHTLTYTVGSSTCMLMDHVVVHVEPLPAVDAGGNIGVCLDAGPQQLGADPQGGTWSGVGVDPLTGVFDPLQALPGGNPVVYNWTDPITGCSNSDNATVTVHPLPEAAFINDPVACVGVPFQFTNTSTGATGAEWDFGDGGTSVQSSPQHVYTAPGTYPVRLVAGTGAGCRDTTHANVIVWDVPQPAIVLSTVDGCGPLEVAFTNNTVGEGVSHAWSFGGLGTSTAVVPPPFTFPADPLDVIHYTVTLTATNTCGAASTQAVVSVSPTPTAAFGPNLNTYCASTPVEFGNASYGLPTSFAWWFGDGGTSTAPGSVVTHTYAPDEEAVDYTVTLIAMNACGSDTVQQTITIVPNEVHAFFNTAPTTGCAPLTVAFTQYSTGDTAWHWDFGDGNFSILEHPVHTFTDPGTYQVELGAFGCGSDTYAATVQVLPQPEVAFTFTPQQACVGEAFTFTDQTPGAAGASWDLGDGTTSTLSTFQHAFAASGTYLVSLTVTAAVTGCTATLVQPVTVLPTPIAAFDPLPGNGCVDLAVTFQNATQFGSYYSWDFGDGNTSAATNPTHTYTTPGTYTVTLTAQGGGSCTHTVTREVIAHPLPEAQFTLSAHESCVAPFTVQAINTSSGAVGYAWNFGNGITSTLNQPQITYTQPGTYTVTLEAINAFGCVDVRTATVVLHAPPEAGFTAAPQPACSGVPITFTNTSTNASGFLWGFGDGTISVAQQPTHTYAAPGAYTVTLVAVGGGGCADTLLVPAAVVVHGTPLADFTTDTLGSVRNARHFHNTSIGASAYHWDFGDGMHSEQEHPVHLFPADGGSFTVCLTAVSAEQCADTVCQVITSGADPIVFVPNAFSPNYDGLNDALVPVLNGYAGPEWDYRFMVFDRWGLLVFETTERMHGWDGRYRGEDAPMDAYVWRVIVGRTYSGEREVHQFTGHATLVR